MRGYLDHNATTPIRAEVAALYAELLATQFGNPGSPHRFGAQASYLLEKSRRRVARSFGSQDREIIFTSGGSEADNLALRGVCRAARRQGRGNHLIISAVEHKAVMDTALWLRDQEGFRLTVLPVDSAARSDPDELRRALRPETVLVSLIAANNEVGSLNPIADLAGTTHEHSRALFHTDAIQALGRVPVDLTAWNVDLASFNAHKIYGPKGIGVLFAREGVWLDAEITGGGQERGRRAGTENVAGAAAFAEAMHLARSELDSERTRQEALREGLWAQLASLPFPIVRNSPAVDCLSNTLNVSLVGFSNQKAMAELDREGFAVSAGSACTSRSTTHSHVLQAMGLGEERLAGALRIGIGRETTSEELAEFASVLGSVLGQLTLRQSGTAS